MPEVLYATPLNGGIASREYAFAADIHIRKIHPILWNLSSAKSFMSLDEQEELKRVELWLCARSEVESLYDIKIPRYDSTHAALQALQIICPAGGRNTYFTFHETKDGYDPFGSQTYTPMRATPRGKLSSSEGQGLAAQFDTIFAGIEGAVRDQVVRLQNPIVLLEHALQSGNSYIGTLMAVMGLDMLFMAGGIDPFVRRANHFLGSGSLVFPPSSIDGCQPNVTVGAVVKDLFEFRNLIAHGQEVAKKFLQPYSLLDTRGQGVACPNPYSYGYLLYESAIFLLAASLREVFLRGHSAAAAQAGTWRPIIEP